MCDYCERVLDQDPENAEAYFGQLMAELKARNRKQLADCTEPFDNRDNYKKVLRFGDETLKKELQGYITDINERNENNRLNEIYCSAKDAMKKADTEETFRAAADIFAKIWGFKDANALAEECLKRAEAIRKDAQYTYAKTKMNGEMIASYEEAINVFQTISNWKDSNEQILICTKKIEEIKAQKKAELINERLKVEKRLIKTKKAVKGLIVAAVIGAVIVCACLVLLLLLYY